MLDDSLVPLPDGGRVYRARRKVRLGDASPSRRLRLDACARYLQDVGNDDTADSGLDATAGEGAGIWVVRRAVFDVVTSPRWNDWVELATWCAGTGGRWAERRLSIRSEGSERSIEATTLWVHLAPGSLMPAKLPDRFLEIYGEAAQGRKVPARLWLDGPPDDDAGTIRTRWPLRATDVDMMGHVNNAAYWDAVEEVLREHQDHPAHPSRGPLRAILEFGAGITRDQQVDLLVARHDKKIDVWFLADDKPAASASLRTLA